MSDDKNVDDLKSEERLKIDIPVEDDSPHKSAADEPDIVGEFKRLGQNFAATLNSVLNSDEVRRVEGEVRTGVKSFVDEVDKAIREAKDSPAAARMKDEASTARERVETSEITHKAQEGIVTGLRWLSTELDKLATQFTPGKASAETPADKEPPAA